MEIIALQTQLFASRRQGLQSEIDGYKQSMDGMRFQLKGLQDSRANKQIQLSSLREQMNSMKQLAADGYLPRNRYLDVQRQFAEVSSSSNETAGGLANCKSSCRNLSSVSISASLTISARSERSWRKPKWTSASFATSCKWLISTWATPPSPHRWTVPWSD